MMAREEGQQDEGVEILPCHKSPSWRLSTLSHLAKSQVFCNAEIDLNSLQFMPRSKEQPSFAGENRQEYDDLFELNGKIDDPALKTYFEERIADVISRARKKMAHIHKEALKEHADWQRGQADKQKVDSNNQFLEEAEAALKRAKEVMDLGALKKELRELWEKADQRGLKEQQKQIAQILVDQNLYPKHTTSWNDRFYVAHKSGIIDRDDLAAMVIRNGISKYFEDVTHEGYPLLALLQKEGIVDEHDYEENISKEEPGYNNTLPPGAIRRLAAEYEITPDKIEGIALTLCLAAMYKAKHRGKRTDRRWYKSSNGGIYDLDADSSRICDINEVKRIADTYLDQDLAKVVRDRADQVFQKR
jgi:hypothetical protein